MKQNKLELGLFAYLKQVNGTKVLFYSFNGCTSVTDKPYGATCFSLRKLLDSRIATYLPTIFPPRIRFKSTRVGSPNALSDFQGPPTDLRPSVLQAFSAWLLYPAGSIPSPSLLHRLPSRCRDAALRPTSCHPPMMLCPSSLWHRVGGTRSQFSRRRTGADPTPLSSPFAWRTSKSLHYDAETH